MGRDKYDGTGENDVPVSREDALNYAVTLGHEINVLSGNRTLDDRVTRDYESDWRLCI